ncbi:MAG: hypothetical protein RLZZ618_986 [Pseudomonadota bacterium]
MKRVLVSPGKYVTVSKMVSERMSRALAASPFTPARVREIVAAEPRNAGTVLVGGKPESIPPAGRCGQGATLGSKSTVAITRKGNNKRVAHTLIPASGKRKAA